MGIIIEINTTFLGVSQIYLKCKADLLPTADSSCSFCFLGPIRLACSEPPNGAPDTWDKLCHGPGLRIQGKPGVACIFFVNQPMLQFLLYCKIIGLITNGFYCTKPFWVTVYKYELPCGKNSQDCEA